MTTFGHFNHYPDRKPSYITIQLSNCQNHAQENLKLNILYASIFVSLYIFQYFALPTSNIFINTHK